MSWTIGIFLLAAVVILNQLLRSKSFIGFMGEQGVRSRLNQLDKSQYIVVNDLMIPSSNGTGTSQIDHIVIFSGGVIVIETKNWGGSIYGKGNDRKWTVAMGRRRYQKENPIQQNNGHIAALRKLLESEIKMYNFVVFTSRANLHLSSIVGANVLRQRQLLNLIKTIRKGTYTDTQVHAVHNLLMMANVTDANARKQHVKSIQQRFK